MALTAEALSGQLGHRFFTARECEEFDFSNGIRDAFALIANRIETKEFPSADVIEFFERKLHLKPGQAARDLVADPFANALQASNAEFTQDTVLSGISMLLNALTYVCTLAFTISNNVETPRLHPDMVKLAKLEEIFARFAIEARPAVLTRKRKLDADENTVERVEVEGGVIMPGYVRSPLSFSLHWWEREYNRMKTEALGARDAADRRNIYDSVFLRMADLRNPAVPSIFPDVAKLVAAAIDPNAISAASGLSQLGDTFIGKLHARGRMIADPDSFEASEHRSKHARNMFTRPSDVGFAGNAMQYHADLPTKFSAHYLEAFHYPHLVFDPEAEFMWRRPPLGHPYGEGNGLVIEATRLLERMEKIQNQFGKHSAELALGRMFLLSDPQDFDAIEKMHSNGLMLPCCDLIGLRPFGQVSTNAMICANPFGNTLRKNPDIAHGMSAATKKHLINYTVTHGVFSFPNKSYAYLLNFLSSPSCDFALILHIVIFLSLLTLIC